MDKKSPLPFFIDNCVSDSVGKALRESGHDVILLRESMPPDTKDPVVAVSCISNGRILVIEIAETSIRILR
jgi:predicted nuclease of predicted toxin-antitoxin system